MKASRRVFIKSAAIVSAGTLVASQSVAAAIASLAKTNTHTFPFVLPPLGYAYNALEPFIDAQTMEIHYTKHHQAYVNKLNEAIEKEPSLKSKTLDELLTGINKLPESVKSAVRNHGGGHWNHTFFWSILQTGTQPGERMQKAIVSQFGSMEQFKKDFEKAAMSVFGSGWAWVVADANNKLTIASTPNQDNPLMDIAAVKGRTIIGIDVWEHAYYLKYQNKRAEYLSGFWNVLNWKRVEEIYLNK
jgi:Fe-Mn family superoxide dismutase